MKHDQVHTVVLPGNGNVLHAHPKPTVLGRPRHQNPRWADEHRKVVWFEFQRLKSLPSWASRDERLIALEAQKVLPQNLQRSFPISPINPTPEAVDFYTGHSVLEAIKRWNDRKVKPKVSPLGDLLGRPPMNTGELNIQLLRQVITQSITPIIRSTGEQTSQLDKLLKITTDLANKVEDLEDQVRRLRKKTA